MPSRWDAATHGWSRRVFHYPLPTLMSRNFRLPRTIELQPLSLTLLKMRKVELKRQGPFPAARSQWPPEPVFVPLHHSYDDRFRLNRAKPPFSGVVLVFPAGSHGGGPNALP